MNPRRPEYLELGSVAGPFLHVAGAYAICKLGGIGSWWGMVVVMAVICPVALVGLAVTDRIVRRRAPR